MKARHYLHTICNMSFRGMFVNCSALLSVLLATTGTEAQVPVYNHKTLYIDPTSILDTLLAPVVDAEARIELQSRFERQLESEGIQSLQFKQYAPVLFTYRDTAVATLLRKIIENPAVDIYFRMKAVHTLGEIGRKEEFNFLKRFARHKNALFKEYVVSALGKVASEKDLDALLSMLQSERNLYVRSTLKASIKHLYDASSVHLSNLPVIDTNGLRKLAFFSSTQYSAADAVLGGKSVTAISRKPGYSRQIVAPHLQYKINKKLYDLIEFPLISFAMRDSWGVHVGEDSGWLFDGMSVHAVMDGVVVAIQYEQSWGCLVIMESSWGKRFNAHRLLWSPLIRIKRLLGRAGGCRTKNRRDRTILHF